MAVCAPVRSLAVQLLQRAAGEDRARPDGGEAHLLGTAARHVVGEDPALLAVHVVTGEDRDHGEALQRHAEVAADHGGEPVRLALQGERGALHLLEVLQLQLEELDHLHREPGGAGDADGGVLVGREDLLDVPLGDDVAHRRPPVAGEHHAAGVRRRDDGGAVRRLHRTLDGGQGTAARQHAPGRDRTGSP